MPIAAVFLVSFAALAFEVLLARIFSLTQWHHLTFMVISMAMFGFAGAGVFLGIMESRTKGWVGKRATSKTFCALAGAYTLGSIVVLVILSRLPLEYLRLPVESRQMAYIVAAYLLPAIPFFIAGAIIALAYAYRPEQAGRIYFANMTGSALGALFPLLCLPLLKEEQLSFLAACVPLILLPFYLKQHGVGMKSFQSSVTGLTKIGLLRKRAAGKLWLLSVAGIPLLAGAILPHVGALYHFRFSSYKDLAQILQVPDTHILQSQNNIRGRIDLVESPYIRYAPGLSLKWTSPVAGRRVLFKDGDGRLVLYDRSLAKARSWAPHTIAWAGYLLADSPARILLLVKNGGVSLACAAAAEPSDLTIVIDHPLMAKVMTDHYQRSVLGVPHRSFLMQSSQTYDLIQIENWGPSLSGTAALTQDHAFTSEQFEEYLRHLTPAGVIVLTRRLRLPPADMIRLWATAYRALARQKVMQPSRHLVVLRNWDTFVLIVSRQPLTSMTALEDFANDRNFDWVYAPDIDGTYANRYNRFEQPFYFNEIRQLAKAVTQNGPNVYFDQYLLDAEPQSDHRPFPNRYLKWGRIGDIYKATGSRFYAFFLSGELMVVAVLVETIFISVLLIFAPSWFGRAKENLGLLQGGFFLAIGLGYILAEIYFIKAFTQVLGDPLISFTFVLTALLIYSGIGGVLSQRFHRIHLYGAIAILIACFGALFWFHGFWTQRLLWLTAYPRYAVSLLLLLPMGFLMGVAFPIGIRDLTLSPFQRARAWALNGCASVISAVTAAQLVISVGIPALILAAALIYALALLVFKNPLKAPLKT